MFVKKKNEKKNAMVLCNCSTHFLHGSGQKNTSLPPHPHPPPPPRKHLMMSDHNITRARFSPRFALKIDRALLQRWVTEDRYLCSRSVHFVPFPKSVLVGLFLPNYSFLLCLFFSFSKPRQNNRLVFLRWHCNSLIQQSVYLVVCGLLTALY